MDKFEAHIRQGKSIELKRDNGEVDKFTIEPLSYQHMPKIFKLLNKLQGLGDVDEKDVDKFLELFDEDTVKILQEIELETLKKSYPDKSEEVLKNFISSNMFDLFLPIMEVNSFGMETDSVETKRKLKTLQKIENK